MAAKPVDQLSFADSVNRSLNLLVVTVLGITALSFGSDLLVETEPLDKVDNTLLVVLGVAGVAWYFIRRNWAQRSPIPVALAAFAVIAQIVGFVIEIGDPTALGDDIPGMTVFVPLLVIAAVLYSINGRYLAAGPRTSG